MAKAAEEKAFFYDTYALFEIAKGNKNYSPYITDRGIAITRLNLMELYYRLLVTSGIDAAERYYDRYKEFCIYVDDATIKRAMLFKAQNKGRDLSYVDCVGYIFAVEKGIRFLTGDMQFKDMEGVEFVK
ncbi:hypothetical protein HYU16_02880 [Candidatus Woesearchaeota archaeon]|nr:hypothetical protein [Candidatus Woesearchaeota archaeon]